MKGRVQFSSSAGELAPHRVDQGWPWTVSWVHPEAPHSFFCAPRSFPFSTKTIRDSCWCRWHNYWDSGGRVVVLFWCQLWVIQFWTGAWDQNKWHAIPVFKRLTVRSFTFLGLCCLITEWGLRSNDQFPPFSLLSFMISFKFVWASFFCQWLLSICSADVLLSRHTVIHKACHCQVSSESAVEKHSWTLYDYSGSCSSHNGSHDHISLFGSLITLWLLLGLQSAAIPRTAFGRWLCRDLGCWIFLVAFFLLSIPFPLILYLAVGPESMILIININTFWALTMYQVLY